MKVRCITDISRNGWPMEYRVTIFGKGLFMKYGNGPIKDEVVTVVSEYWHDGDKYYCFMEWPNDCGYTAHDFVPIEPEKEKFEEVSFEKIKEHSPISKN